MKPLHIQKKKASKLVTKTAIYIILLFVAALILFPLLNIIIVSINTEKDLVANPLNIPKSINFENYIYAWEKSKFLLYGFNTVVVCMMTITMNVICASLAAYAIDRFEFKEVKSSYYYFMMGIFVPIQVIILPLFKNLKATGLMNNLFGLAIIYTATTLPLSILMFTGFYKTIPKELDESALVDGCKPFKCFWRIIFPLSKVVVATVTVLISLEVWRDFFIPLVVVTSPSKKTLTSGLLNLMSEFSVEWTKFSAAMVMQAIPIIILFLLLQKYFTKGVVSGAVKG